MAKINQVSYAILCMDLILTLLILLESWQATPWYYLAMPSANIKCHIVWQSFAILDLCIHKRTCGSLAASLQLTALHFTVNCDIFILRYAWPLFFYSKYLEICLFVSHLSSFKCSVFFDNFKDFYIKKNQELLIILINQAIIILHHDFVQYNYCLYFLLFYKILCQKY